MKRRYVKEHSQFFWEGSRNKSVLQQFGIPYQSATPEIQARNILWSMMRRPKKSKKLLLILAVKRPSIKLNVLLVCIVRVRHNKMKSLCVYT